MYKNSNYNKMDNNGKKLFLRVTIDNLIKKYYAIMNVLEPTNKILIKYIENHYENPFGKFNHIYLCKQLKKYSKKDLDKLTITMEKTKKRIIKLRKEKELL